MLVLDISVDSYLGEADPVGDFLVRVESGGGACLIIDPGVVLAAGPGMGTLGDEIGVTLDLMMVGVEMILVAMDAA